MTLFMLDLCAGLGGASLAMKDRGWKVVTLDNNAAFEPDICADLRTWSWDGERPDLIWCSPPCTEFSRSFLPWLQYGRPPDLSIYDACRRIIEEVKPRYWILENVRGAVKYFGKYSAVYYPYYLWGFFPPLGDIRMKRKMKKKVNWTKKAERAKIPYCISWAVALAVEHQIAFL